MARIVRRETRKRGFFGWVFLLLFLGFNAVFALLFARAFGMLGALQGTAEMAGGGIALGLLLIFWACGAVITGLLALLTRGQRTVVEEYPD